MRPDENGVRMISTSELVPALLAEARSRLRVVCADEQVGLQGADAHQGRKTDVSGDRDDGNAFIEDEIGEAVGLLDANVRDQGADQHGQDENTGADAELGFEFHAVP